MDRRAVRRARHPPVERVDFAHQMALAESADRRVARHRPDQRRIEPDERDARAQPRGGGGGPGPGVSTTDPDAPEHSSAARRAAHEADSTLICRWSPYPQIKKTNK